MTMPHVVGDAFALTKWSPTSTGAEGNRTSWRSRLRNSRSAFQPAEMRMTAAATEPTNALP